MSIKKKLLLGSALAILSLPVASFADLVTYNYTKEVSAVKIQSTGACSGLLGHSTDPVHADGTPGQSSTGALAIRLLCAGSQKNTCHATMYASSNCTGNPVANMSLDMTTLAATVDNGQMLDPKYSVTTSGANVYIRYAG